MKGRNNNCFCNLACPLTLRSSVNKEMPTCLRQTELPRLRRRYCHGTTFTVTHFLGKDMSTVSRHNLISYQPIYLGPSTASPESWHPQQQCTIVCLGVVKEQRRTRSATSQIVRSQTELSSGRCALATFHFFPCQHGFCS